MVSPCNKAILGGGDIEFFKNAHDATLPTAGYATSEVMLSVKASKKMGMDLEK